MKLARKTTGAILLGFIGGVVCGATISVVATFFGPHAAALDSASPAEIFRLATGQGVLIGMLIGPVLGPLAYFALEHRATPLRIVGTTALGTLLLGAGVGLAAGPAAGLAGGVLGFFGGVVVLSPPASSGSDTDRRVSA